MILTESLNPISEFQQVLLTAINFTSLQHFTKAMLQFYEMRHLFTRNLKELLILHTNDANANPTRHSSHQLNFKLVMLLLMHFLITHQNTFFLESKLNVLPDDSLNQVLKMNALQREGGLKPVGRPPTRESDLTTRVTLFTNTSPKWTSNPNSLLEPDFGNLIKAGMAFDFVAPECEQWHLRSQGIDILCARANCSPSTPNFADFRKAPEVGRICDSSRNERNSA